MSNRRGLALHWKIVIGFVLGALVGIALDRLWTPGTWSAIGVNDPKSYLSSRGREVFATGVPSDANAEAGAIAASVRVVRNLNLLVGQLFFQSLRFIAVPIVFCSLIVGVASLGDPKRLGRIGLRTMLYFGATGVVAISLGLIIANVVQPGKFVDSDRRATMMAEHHQAKVAASVQQTDILPSGWQQAISVIPSNPFEALATAQLLQVIFFAIAVGLGLTMIPQDRARPVIAFFDVLTDVIIKLVGVVMRIAPFAVFALVVSAISEMGLDVLGALLVYSLTVVGGLAIVLLGVYPLVLRLMSGVGYARFFRAMSPAMLTAFSSSSSNATLPVTITCVNRRLGVSERIASFVCPLGTTINMDGTAMYQGVAALFIAQMYGLDLGIGAQVTIVLTALLASIGTPGIPGAGIVMLVIVLESAKIPAEGIAIILGVDRLLDMFRTVINVSGDAVAAAVIAKSEGELLTEAELAKRVSEGTEAD